MSSLFVKGLLLKSVDESYLPARLKQRRTGENGDLRRLNRHRQPPFIRWTCRGDLSAARRVESRIGGLVPLRAVLNPVSPHVTATKKAIRCGLTPTTTEGRQTPRCGHQRGALRAGREWVDERKKKKKASSASAQSEPSKWKGKPTKSGLIVLRS